VRTARIPVVIVALLALAACGGGGTSFPSKPTVEGPIVSGSKGVWIFRPAGRPKRLVIFFHGQGGATEATPANHRPWIDHLVSRGAAVVYPRYELDYSPAVLGPAVAGIRTATDRLGLDDVPVLALGYSRGGALAVEYGAVAPSKNVPVPDLIESVNTVPYGEWTKAVDLRPLKFSTVVALIVSDQDPRGPEGASGLLNRLRRVGFPGINIRLDFARSHGSFVADHLAPMELSPAAQKAYWKPTDLLLDKLKHQD
jgi:pimeloyl-ACP methyl ester carboxylesterase